MTARDLIERMITRSDNTATDGLLAAVGGPKAVNDWARRAGIQNFNLTRDIATLLSNPRAVQLIQKIIGDVFCGALLHMPEFSLNFALLHTWLARHGNTSIASN